jgi:3-oxoacyl-[acyl-carrier-protein] synthase-3
MTEPLNPLQPDEKKHRELVRHCLEGALRPGDTLPADGDDWIETGLLDSMSLVDVLLCVEKETGLAGFVDEMEGRPPRCTADLVAALQAALSEHTPAKAPMNNSVTGESGVPAALIGWGTALGSQRIEADVVERRFSLAAGTLTERAGIESVVHASTGKTEVDLAKQACTSALARANIDASALDWILATSETFLGYPSLGALIHTQLRVPKACGVLDIGGACVGLLNAMFVGSNLITAGLADCILVASSDVHSRVLAPGTIDGTFGGLFGDGASAFILRRADGNSHDTNAPYGFGRFIFGCDGTHADALRLHLRPQQAFALQFNGGELARAAVRRLAEIIAELESLNGVSRFQAAGFALHQPNPRLVSVLAKEAGISIERIPLVAKTCGNLGSSTCGVALSRLLDKNVSEPQEKREPIFMAAVGPGLLSGGVVLR